MLDAELRTQIANDIEGVYQTRAQLPLLTKTYPEITIEDSYRVQEELIRRKLAAGAKVKGYKVGLTSKAMQELAGSSEPDFSTLTDDLFFPEDTPLPAAQFFTPMAEAEIAFVLRDELKGPGVLPVDVIRATDFVLPAIEIVDGRVKMIPGMTIVDTVADLAGCGGVLLGANPRRLDQIDLNRITAKAFKNGELIAEGQASAVLGSPVTSVAWLANKLSTFGVSFKPGDVILTGSMLRAFPIKAGDAVRCLFDGGLGEVLTSFE